LLNRRLRNRNTGRGATTLSPDLHFAPYRGRFLTRYPPKHARARGRGNGSTLDDRLARPPGQSPKGQHTSKPLAWRPPTIQRSVGEALERRGRSDRRSVRWSYVCLTPRRSKSVGGHPAASGFGVPGEDGTSAKGDVNPGNQFEAPIVGVETNHAGTHLEETHRPGE